MLSNDNTGDQSVNTLYANVYDTKSVVSFTFNTIDTDCKRIVLYI